VLALSAMCVLVRQTRRAEYAGLGSGIALAAYVLQRRTAAELEANASVVGDGRAVRSRSRWRDSPP
jgi:hypothetical protein